MAHQCDIGIKFVQNTAGSILHMQLGQGCVRINPQLPECFIVAGDIEPLYLSCRMARHPFKASAIIHAAWTGTIIENRQ